MIGNLQNGIYYGHIPPIGNSLGLVFFRVNKDSNANSVAKTLGNIWSIIENLKGGVVKNMKVHPRHLRSGNLSALIGYGKNIFEVSGVKRPRPKNFNELWLFRSPDHSGGGGPIYEDSQFRYGEDVIENHALDDHIVIQFIGDNEFYTSRAIIEIWKELNLSYNSGAKPSLHLSAFYSGFQRADKRNWVGFHDGLSNMKSSDRLRAIAMSTRHLESQDQWLTNGTYMAFLRIGIDLDRWEKTDIETQEKLVGRDKESGCPLIGINADGKPLKDPRCPVPGTYEVIEKGNEKFREHPAYGHQGLRRGISDELLKYSHIGTTSPITYHLRPHVNSFRIFRQGFEFLEPVNEKVPFRVGLNFISFQNTPESVFKSLTYQSAGNVVKSTQQTSPLYFSDYFSVRAGGIFLVPPIVKNEPFPGSSIFISMDELPSRLVSQGSLYKK
jgi:deferrochelatase/peroxidase EfeB